MQHFTVTDIRAMSDGVHAMYCAASLSELADATLTLLASLIPNEIALLDDRAMRPGGRSTQLARLLGDASATSHPLSFSPRGQFVLHLVRPHFGRARELLTPTISVDQPSVAIDLTPREREVLYWVSEGKTNGQIGVILNASARTIQKHLEHIFQKLGVETRTSATVRAIEMGLLATISMAIA